MQQFIKRFFWIVLLVAGLQTSWGFSLLGPRTLANGADAWQTAVIGYDLAYATLINIPGDSEFMGDIGGPRNIAEEYRRNVPVYYYAYNQTFLNYFGTSGAASVDGAYTIINGLPSADKVNLSLYPLESMHYNYTAESLYLTDLKSKTLHLLVEQLGLADPERFVWTLHDRFVFPGCPLTTEYVVVQRNLDYLPTPLNQIQYSSYINDIFYTYFIVENCTGPNPLAYTVPFSTDPEAAPFSSVAANNFDGNLLFSDGSYPHTTSGGLQIGAFYSGLTRDDVAGLKYLFSTNNVNWELPDPNSLLFTISTNLALQQLYPNGGGTNNTGTNGGGFYSYDGNIGYGDYGWLVAFSLTNSPAVLQAYYPGLVIASSSNYFVLATNITYSQYFTNSGYGQPYPPPLILVTVTNRTPYLQQRFVTKFANVFPNRVSPNSVAIQQTISVVPNVGAPYGSPPLTNVTSKTITSVGVPSGDFFLLPLFHTNICPLDILYTGLTNVVAITNFLTGTSTNIVTTTNTSSYSSTMIQINYFTNYTYVTHPVNCAEVANVANNYQGIGGSKFVRANYDSLIGQYFQPITNYYTMVALTNYQWQLQHFVRVVTQPDILMDAADLGNFTVIRDINFTPSPALQGLAGPGTINSSPAGTAPITFTYNKIGDSTWNGYDINTFLVANTNSFLYQIGEIPSLAWASFDSSTNDPVLYPNGASIQNLESILAVSFSPSTPPDGYSGTFYSVDFNVTGGSFSPPYTWSAYGIPVGGGVVSGLPPGMSVMTAVNGTDVILSGTPTNPGLYDFILQLTDSLGRSVQWNFTITIH